MPRSFTRPSSPSGWYLGRSCPTRTEGTPIQMNKIRVFTLGLVATGVLLWALPATAHRTAAKATVVTVTAGKPSEFRFTLSTKTVKHGTVTFKVTSGGALP